MSSRDTLFGSNQNNDRSLVQYMQLARVKDIVLGPNKGGTNYPDANYSSPADIGKIYYELLYSPIDPWVSEPAWPLWSFVKQFPLINEIVIVVKGPSRGLNDKSTSQQQFYFPAYAMWGDPNQNGFPNLQEWSQYLKDFESKPEYAGSSTVASQDIFGYTFKDKPKVKNLRPFEGDSILQGRFGQSIRFGSTVPEQKRENTWSNSGESGDPITIICNEQKVSDRIEKTLRKFDPIVEDINRDGSMIILTSTQEIFLEDVNNFPFRSFEKGIVRQDQPVYEFPRPITVPNDFRSDFEIDTSVTQNT